jgi:type I restriction enzyme M protein
MAEVDNVGYKRTNRGEIEMPNELFTLEYAPDKIDNAKIITDMEESIDAAEGVLNSLKLREKSEKDASKKSKIQNKIKEQKQLVTTKKQDLKEIKAFLAKYYDATGTIISAYEERLDDTLIAEFKNGRLKKYQSTYVALHSTSFKYILDYMRQIQWD